MGGLACRLAGWAGLHKAASRQSLRALCTGLECLARLRLRAAAQSLGLQAPGFGRCSADPMAQCALAQEQELGSELTETWAWT